MRVVPQFGLAFLLLSSRFRPLESFAAPIKRTAVASSLFADAAASAEKAKLLELLGRTVSEREGAIDSVLADAETKEPLRISPRGTLFGGERGLVVEYGLKSSTHAYEGRSSSFIDLLEPKAESDTSEDRIGAFREGLRRNVIASIPPPIRSALAVAGFGMGEEYVPMRDLFTSEAVSFAYERGWRQGFANAGFPGPDVEFEMAREYFAPALASSSVVVDMSCATGKTSLGN